MYIFKQKKILWTEQQLSKSRVKRDWILIKDEDGENEPFEILDKRAAELAYKSIRYDAPEWSSQQEKY